MPSEKRDRQRANRDLKRAEEQKVDVRKKRFRMARRYTVYVVLFLGVIFVLQWFTG